jgi:tight adherence protein B
MSAGSLIFIAIALVVVVGGGLTALGLRGVLSSGDPLRDRLQAYATVADYAAPQAGRKGRGRFARLRLRANMMLSSLASESLSVQLMSADWPLTVVEFILIRFGAALLGFLLGWAVGGSFIAGGVVGVVGYVIPGLFLQRSINARRQKFERQLVDVLVLINGAVRAGFSLLQAMEVVVKEMKAPASDEFRRVTREVGLGVSLGRALTNLGTRMQNRDLDLVVTAINIHYQVGGNLSTMLAAVTETIRDRIRLFSEVRVLTTQQRYTSYLLSLLPFFVAAILFLMNPDYMRGLWDPRIRCIPVGAILGIIAGYFVIRRLGRIDI